MATESTRGYTYQDLLELPEGNHLSVINGELLVSPAPSLLHQETVIRLVVHMARFARQAGGKIVVAPFAVFFSDTDVVEADVFYVREANLPRFEERRIVGAPDFVVEVSSPSTRHLEVARKRRLYEANGVPEYWWVDLDADRVEVYRLGARGYGLPALFGRGDVPESPLLPGISISGEEMVGPAGE
ncbi:MAG: Uma2 family endonuclease [Actinomycetota bacterium]